MSASRRLVLLRLVLSRLVLSRLVLSRLALTGWSAPSLALAAGPARTWSAAALTQPEALLRLHSDDALGLIGVGGSGSLFRWAAGALPPTRIAAGLDPAAPIATGHGRIAARRPDGTLALWEQGRLQGSRGVRLAPQAGLLVLPLAVIGVAVDAESTAHRLVRLEPDAAGVWREVARSTAVVLPDARPVQVDLDGRGDGGHIAVLAGPDADRYDHGVLGDGIEATQALWLERHELSTLRDFALPAPFVFEDIVLRPVPFEGGTGLLTVRSGPRGGQLALLARDPTRAGRIQLRALGDTVGGRHRWLSPTTDGTHWMAVHTPHIGGVLHEYRLAGDRLERRVLGTDISTHRLGSRELDLAVWLGAQLLVPSQDGRRLRVLEAAAGFAESASLALPGRLAMARAWPAAGGAGVLLDDGRALHVSARA